MGTAGAFTVKMGLATYRFNGLAPKASIRHVYSAQCASGDRTVVADGANEVRESDETNNTRSGSFLC